MIGANAVANEVAIQMLDKFDLTGWQFAGETTPGGAARVLVMPPELPPGTGYYVVVAVNEDEPLGPQIEKAVDNLSKLMTSGASVKAGSTPDEQLDGFFAGLNMPPEVAAARLQAMRSPKEAPSPSPAPQSA